MSILLFCPNGHKLSAKVSLAGHKMACPVCRASIVVPQPQSGIYVELEESSAAPSNKTIDAPVAQSPVLPSARNASVVTKKSLLLWGTGAAAAGTLLACVFVGIVWFMFIRRPPVNEVVTQSVDRGRTGHNPVPDATSNERGVQLDSSTPASLDEFAPKLRQVAIALHNHVDANRGFVTFSTPQSADVEVANQSPRLSTVGLSWRVQLLPFLEQQPLYSRFHLDESWDSPHNLQLLELMPEVFRIGGTSKSHTRLRVISGPGMLFGTNKPFRFGQIRDGSRHTILALVVGTDKAVPWTQPDTFTLDSNDPVGSLGVLPERVIVSLMADTRVLMLPLNVDGATLTALSTPDGGEVIDADRLRREFEERRSEISPSTSVPRSGSGPAHTAMPNEKSRLSTLEAVRRTKLRELIEAMYRFHDVNRRLPPVDKAEYVDSRGKPCLSWRVHLLPYLQQTPMYERFKLNEPWDSPHNLALLAEMPDVFRDPQIKDATLTPYVILTGEGTCYPTPFGMKYQDFKDDAKSTALIVTCGSDKAVPWTKPGDIEFDLKRPVECLGKLDFPLIYFAWADGAVGTLPANSPGDLFKAIISPSGGEVLPANVKHRIIK